MPIKPASKTAFEYIELFKGLKTGSADSSSAENTRCVYLKNFADIYSELRWREFENMSDETERFNLLVQEYNNILSLKKRGLNHFIKRLFSLRGLAYL
jgi:hypothetical protein